MEVGVIDFHALALAAKRANSAYVENDDESKAAFEALGDIWVAQFQDDSRQACLSVDPGGAAWLSISGTRASQGQLLDIYRDTQLEPVAVKGGTVTRGVCDGMDHVFDWALSTAPAGTVLNVCGHSLGAARAALSLAYLPADQVGALYSFAQPKFLAADFYKTYAAELSRMTCIVSGRDGWCSWPWFDKRWQSRPPIQHIWLKDDRGTFAMIDGNKWPGGWNFGDHDMGEYQVRIEKIAAMSDVKPAA
ncbi:hypothetical protein AB4Y32_15825 [Paraburkholderia phymatum]|uniref:Uncharacterized protein n=1 Tax=Paraburkholderia phymatum TaxID=148447 RepID=A0ACC6U0Y5_9BURK